MREKRKRSDLAETLSTLLPDVPVRPIRPRPLPYEEKMRVWSLDDPEFEKFNPAVAKWMRQRVALAHALKEKPKGKSKASMRAGIENEIRVPAFRVVDNIPCAVTPQRTGTGGEQAYIRHIEKTQEELEERVEYDVDSDDEAWLQKRQQKGLDDIDIDLLELLIDRFERNKHAVLCERQTEWEKKGPSRAGVAPEDKAPGVLYPASQAINDFGEEYTSLSVRAAHNYWAQKAAKSKIPLLQRYWYGKRWARQNALQTRREEREEDNLSEGIPFQGKGSPRKAGVRVRALSNEDARSRLLIARADLELVRTLADQVKRREKLKKKSLLAWEHELRLSVLASSLSPKSKKSAQKAVAVEKVAVKPVKVISPASLLTARKPAAAPQPKTTKALKRVSFGKPDTKAEEHPPQRTGLVSAVVNSIRRLSSWSKQVQTTEEIDKHLVSTPASGLDEELLVAQSGDEDDQDFKVSKSAKTSKANSKQRSKHKGHAAVDSSIIKFPARKGSTAPAVKRQSTAGVKKKSNSATKIAQEALLADDTDNDADTEQHSAPAGGQRAPVGFKRMAASKDKPVQWHVTCTAGKYILKSCAEVLQFLKQHGHSRPAWKPLLQGPDESSTAYRHRLRLKFPFTELSELSPFLQAAAQTTNSPRSFTKDKHAAANLKRQKAKKGQPGLPKVKRKQPAQTKAKPRRKTDQTKAISTSKKTQVPGELEPPSKKRANTKNKHSDSAVPAMPDYFDVSLLIGRTTRGGTAFGNTVTALPSRPKQSRRQRELLQSAKTAADLDREASSCSHTYVSADSGLSDQDNDAPRSALRSSNPKAAGNSTLKSSRFRHSDSDGENSEDASDMSAYPDASDPPPLPPATRSQQVLRRLTQPPQQSGRSKSVGNKGIVAAARQRAKRQRVLR